MILTIALSPSIEKNILLDELKMGQDNKMSYHDFTLGESAIYSAYMVRLLQGEPYLLGFAGGMGGRYIKYFTDKQKIKSDLLWKEGETRSITKIVEADGRETRLLNPGFSYDEQDVKNFKLKFNSHIKDMYGVIINNHPTDNTYAKEMLEVSLRLSAEYRLKTIISLSGSELKHALLFKPYAMALTQKDICDLGIKASEEKEQINLAHEMLINDKIHMLYFLKNQCLYAVTKNKMAKVELDKEVQNEKRMKDMLTGVLGVCVSRKYEMEKTLRLMGAVIKAADFNQFPLICTRKEVNDQTNKVTLIELYNSRNGYLI